jgi:CheY-like chemotaxis protein
MRLLLVEDNPANVALFQAVLESEGHSITVRIDGSEGYELAGSEAFDALLLDIQMPGMSGDAICRGLRAAGHTLPILALSASALPDQIETAMRAGFTAYLTKPISPQALREAVRKLDHVSGT